MGTKRKRKPQAQAIGQKGIDQSQRIAQFEEALRDAEDALRIADRNLRGLKKKFLVVFKRQRHCRVQKTKL